MRPEVLERSIHALNDLSNLLGYEKPIESQPPSGRPYKFFIANAKEDFVTERIAFVKVDRDKSQDSVLNIVKNRYYRIHAEHAQNMGCREILYVAYAEQNGFQLILPERFARDYFKNNVDQESHFTISTSNNGLKEWVAKGAVLRWIEEIEGGVEANDQIEVALRRLLPETELVRRAIHNKIDRKIETKTSTYSRNDAVALVTKLMAEGICQLCDQPAPFSDVFGNPYLESHHIVWRRDNGPDCLENTAALCPNCHRKMHILGLSDDVTKLSKQARGNVVKLRDRYPLQFQNFTN